MAHSIMDQLVAFGAVRRGLLGVSIARLTPEIAQNYQLDSTTGALITAVSSDSAAERAGLQIGDVIVSVNGQAIGDPVALRNTIGLLRPGDRVEVGYFRDGRRRTVTAVLDELDAPALAREDVGELDPAFEGATLAINDDSRPDFNGTAGILVTDIVADSPAGLRGLRTGDVITHVNRQRVRTLTEVREILADARSVILQVQRGDRGLLLLMR
jgi:S1-C subfamily serine protease